MILVKAIQKARKTSRRTKVGKWIPQFKKLRTLDDIDKERIREVLLWYTTHLKGKYIPKVYSAEGFRNKFFQIEEAMERTDDSGVEEDFDVKTYRKGNIIIDEIDYNS